MSSDDLGSMGIGDVGYWFSDSWHISKLDTSSEFEVFSDILDLESMQWSITGSGILTIFSELSPFSNLSTGFSGISAFSFLSSAISDTSLAFNSLNESIVDWASSIVLYEIWICSKD
ncbi:2978_t:CDS:2 [Diversispora eburnea]|uniref:2978_t:CDS:1 n=1 Tax=Diversispora eburnea TaxID=1213867 RepID=A0A9N9F5A3_9GLOM|nr:2978_t:CDS:2 [Diversispora eburnea]